MGTEQDRDEAHGTEWKHNIFLCRRGATAENQKFQYLQIRGV